MRSIFTTKRKMYLLLALSITCTLVFLSTGIFGAETKEEGKLVPVRVIFATGGEGTPLHLMGGLFASAIPEVIPGSEITVIPGAVASNPVTVANKIADISFCMTTYTTAAINGREPYEKQGPMSQLRQVVWIYQPSFLHLMARNNLPDSMEEIIEQKYPLKFSVNERGSSVETHMKRLVEYYGVTFEDFKSWGGGPVYTTQPDAVGLFRDGLIDMVPQTTTPRSAIPMELMSTGKAKLIPLKDDVLEYFSAEFGYTDGFIPAGTYTNQPEDVKSTLDNNLLICHEDLDEDIVYSLTRAICENYEAIVSGFSGIKDWVPEKHAATKTAVPMHPGAIRYYQEQGWLD